MRTLLVFAALSLSLGLALTACGGGGDSASDGTVTPPPATTLGSRAMPGSTITVTPETAISAGQPLRVLISAPDLPNGATVTAAVGVDRETATAATLTPLPANQWRAALTLPSPLPVATSVWVTVTLADGSILESGIEDFVLAR